MSSNRDLAFIEWLKQNHRAGYIEAFKSLQLLQPHVLQGLDNNDWIDIFLKLPPAESSDSCIDLCEMFSSVSLN